MPSVHPPPTSAWSLGRPQQNRDQSQPLSYEKNIFTRRLHTRKPFLVRKTSTTNWWLDGSCCLLLWQKLVVPFSVPVHSLLLLINPCYLSFSLHWTRTMQILRFPRIWQHFLNFFSGLCGLFSWLMYTFHPVVTSSGSSSHLSSGSSFSCIIFSQQDLSVSSQT